MKPTTTTTTQSNILYLGCPKVTHNKLPLCCVCIDSTCSNRSLVCKICQSKLHNHHHIIPLSEFLSNLESVRMDRTIPLLEQSYSHMLKRIKDEAHHSIEELRKLVTASLQKLKSTIDAELNKLYTSLTTQISDFRITPDKDFIYSPQSESAQKIIQNVKEQLQSHFHKQDLKRLIVAGIQEAVGKYERNRAERMPIFQELVAVLQASIAKSIHKLEKNLQELRVSKPEMMNRLIVVSGSEEDVGSPEMRVVEVGGIKEIEETGFKFVQKPKLEEFSLRNQKEAITGITSKDDFELNKDKQTSTTVSDKTTSHKNPSSKLSRMNSDSTLRQTHLNRFNRWSPTCKHPDISTNQTIASRVSNTTGDTSCIGILSTSQLSNSPLVRKSWTFKIQNLVKWIGIGITLNNTMVSCQYKFSQTKGHANYIMGSQGVFYIYNRKNQDLREIKGFKFTTNDEIDVLYSGLEQKITFTKNLNQRCVVAVEEVPYGDCYRPCAFMREVGDAVRIGEKLW